MCGIIAIKGKETISKVVDGLKKLEYRGYDSCGLAYKKLNKIYTEKVTGYITNLESEVKDLKSKLCIGHTRWATHGKVTISNSHPHMSSSGDFVIVHNGIIENYLDLKRDILSNVSFVSETDSEVIAHLIEYYYRGNVFEAFKKAISNLVGSYAIVMICKYDNSIYFARKSSPLVIAKSGKEYCVSSDINGLCNRDEVYYLNDGEYGYINSKVHLFDSKHILKDINFMSYDSDVGKVTKGDYEHFMIKEIHEIPTSLKRGYWSFKNTEFELPLKIENVLFVCCGTSYHSSLMGKKFIEKYSGIACECEIASEFIYNEYIAKANTLAIFISQSGETADTLSALRKAKSLGLFCLAITNVRDSSITRLADSVIYMDIGPEICVASTKAYVTQVLLLILLSNVFINIKHCNYIINSDKILVEGSKTINYLNYTEEDLTVLFNLNIAEIEENVKTYSSFLSNTNVIHLIGKDMDYITSLEGSLKIKEVSYIFTDAYPCGELKHGTLSLITEDSYVLSIITCEDIFEKSMNATHEISARGGKCIYVSQFELEKYGHTFGYIKLPEVNELFLPIISIIPIDILAYQISVNLGYNPDKPRNLAKSVTVE